MERGITSGTDYVIAPQIPRGLAPAIEGLAREILRHRPRDVYAFAARHFDKLIASRNKAARKSFNDWGGCNGDPDPDPDSYLDPDPDPDPDLDQISNNRTCAYKYYDSMEGAMLEKKATRSSVTLEASAEKEKKGMKKESGWSIALTANAFKRRYSKSGKTARDGKISSNVAFDQPVRPSSVGSTFTFTFTQQDKNAKSKAERRKEREREKSQGKANNLKRQKSADQMGRICRYFGETNEDGGMVIGRRRSRSLVNNGDRKELNVEERRQRWYVTEAVSCNDARCNDREASGEEEKKLAENVCKREETTSVLPSVVPRQSLAKCTKSNANRSSSNQQHASANFVLPPISSDPLKEIKPEADLTFPCLSSDALHLPENANPNPNQVQTQFSEADDRSKEKQRVDVSENRIEMEQVAEEMEETEETGETEETEESDDSNSQRGYIEEAFKDSLNVTPDSIDFSQRADSLEDLEKEKVEEQVEEEEEYQANEVEKGMESMLAETKRGDMHSGDGDGDASKGDGHHHHSQLPPALPPVPYSKPIHLHIFPYVLTEGSPSEIPDKIPQADLQLSSVRSRPNVESDRDAIEIGPFGEYIDILAIPAIPAIQSTSAYQQLGNIKEEEENDHANLQYPRNENLSAEDTAAVFSEAHSPIEQKENLSSPSPSPSHRSQSESLQQVCFGNLQTQTTNCSDHTENESQCLSRVCDTHVCEQPSARTEQQIARELIDNFIHDHASMLEKQHEKQHENENENAISLESNDSLLATLKEAKEIAATIDHQPSQGEQMEEEEKKEEAAAFSVNHSGEFHDCLPLPLVDISTFQISTGQADDSEARGRGPCQTTERDRHLFLNFLPNLVQSSAEYEHSTKIPSIDFFHPDPSSVLLPPPMRLFQISPLFSLLHNRFSCIESTANVSLTAVTIHGKEEAFRESCAAAAAAAADDIREPLALDDTPEPIVIEEISNVHHVLNGNDEIPATLSFEQRKENTEKQQENSSIEDQHLPANIRTSVDSTAPPDISSKQI